MTLLPKIKLKTLPTFPSSVIGGTGLTATKANGSITLDYAWQEFGAISAIPTSPTSYILTYDTQSNAYVMVPSHLLGGAVAGIADVPIDGVQYGRQSVAGAGTWTPIGGGSFVQAGTGAVTRTMQDKARERVSVKDFGAVGDGVADDTAAIQATITAFQGSGAAIYFPRGNYKITATLSVTAACHFEGESRAATTITWTSPTLTAVSVNTNSQFICERIIFSGNLSATAGAMITLDGPGGAGSVGGNGYSIFRDCSFFGGNTQIFTISAAHWLIDSCLFTVFRGFGVYISNVNLPDSGDSCITNCLFSTDPLSTTTAGVAQVSSGGLKLIGNKFVGGLYGYTMALGNIGPTGTGTVDLLMVGNSIENQSAGAIHFTNPSGNNVFGSVVIDGNQITGNAFHTQPGNWNGIQIEAGANWFNRFAITDNVIMAPLTSAGDASGLIFVCISIGSAASSFYVGGNELTTAPNNGGPTYGIAIGSTSANGLIGDNHFDSISGGVWAAKILTPLPATVFSTMPVPQSGTASVTCSTANGSLWAGSVAVTFPTPYDFVPKVTCTPGDVATGIAAFPQRGTITSTGFTLICKAATNGGAGTATWDAFGVL